MKFGTTSVMSAPHAGNTNAERQGYGMGRYYDNDYERRREERREEKRRYEADVSYDAWRSGGNSDRIDNDRVRQSYDDGLSHESAARRELNAQRPKEPEMTEEEYYNQQQQNESVE